jgi:proline iminopeptidase
MADFGETRSRHTEYLRGMHPTTDLHPPGIHVRVNDTRLWVEREGQGEPLLLLSGGPANSHLTFHPAFSALADSYEVIYVDYRGRGRSDPVADYRTITFAQDVADIEALRDTLGLERMHIYGFSYGGMVAQAYALEHPDRVSSLVLANTVHSPEMWQKNHENINREIANQFPEVWDEIMRLRAAGVRSTAPEVQALYRVHGPLVRFYNPDNAAKLLAEPGSRNSELYAVFAGDDIEFFIGGEVAQLPDFRPRLNELRMPLLIIAGRYDRALYPSYQREFARYATRAEFVMMERSGSFAHIEEPEALMAHVRRFIESAAGSLPVATPVQSVATKLSLANLPG